MYNSVQFWLPYDDDADLNYQNISRSNDASLILLIVF